MLGVAYKATGVWLEGGLPHPRLMTSTTERQVHADTQTGLLLSEQKGQVKETQGEWIAGSTDLEKQRALRLWRFIQTNRAV